MDPREDFRVFLALVWRHLGLPVPTKVQYDIAHRLQHGPRRHIVEAFRGVGKSYITSAYVLWLLLRNPQEKALVVSASKQRADEFSTFTKRIADEMPLLAHLSPRPEQRHSLVAWDVGPATPAHAPSVKAMGITGQLTGSRAGIIVADDVEVVNNSLTMLKRKRLIEYVKEFEAILTPGGRVVFLGTPQIEDSLYNHLQDSGYRCRIWPARYPDQKLREFYGSRLSPLLSRELDEGQASPGHPTDPLRFNEDELAEREVSYGASGFALQFMLNTSLSDADLYPLKLRDLLIYDQDDELAPNKLLWSSDGNYTIQDLPCVGLHGDHWQRPSWVSEERSKYAGCVMAIDPAGRGKDRVGWAFVRYLNGYLYVPAMGSLRGGYESPNLHALAKLALEYKPNLVLVEPQFGGGMMAELLKPVIHKYRPCSVEDAPWSNVQKERRVADTLEPVMARHRLVVDPRCIRSDYDDNQGPEEQYHIWQYQMSRLTRERGALRHDDSLDALSIAVSYWVTSMGVDVESEVKKRANEVLDRSLRAYFDGVLPVASTRPRNPNLLGDL
jgi:Autographiviridae terminase large subunit